MIKEILFIKSVLEFIKKMTINLPILIFCDNEGAIYLSNNHESRRTKHIDTKIHFIRDYVENGTVIIKFIASEDNLADPLTKNVNQKIMSKNFCFLLMKIFE